MRLHHLISIDGDQLLQPVSDRQDLFRAIGTAVVQACDKVSDQTIVIPSSASGAVGDPRITVKYIENYEDENFELWVWVDGDTIYVNQLPDAEPELIIRLSSVIDEIRLTGGRSKRSH